MRPRAGTRIRILFRPPRRRRILNGMAVAALFPRIQSIIVSFENKCGFI